MQNKSTLLHEKDSRTKNVYLLVYYYLIQMCSKKNS